MIQVKYMVSLTFKYIFMKIDSQEPIKPHNEVLETENVRSIKRILDISQKDSY